MMRFSRDDNSLLGQWWWTVDRTLLAMVLVMCLAGLLMVMTASPAVAAKLGKPSLYFVYRQAIFMGAGVLAIFLVSLAPKDLIRRLALPGLIVALILVWLTLVVGTEVKGASRWLRFAGVGLQPSEFLKPFLILFIAFLLSAKFEDEKSPAFTIAGLVTLFACVPILLQPDLGQTVLICAVILAQMILAGLPTLLISVAGAGGFVMVATAYFTMPHVTHRIDSFINPEGNDTYQADKALDAFEAGGMLGAGPGEGAVKNGLPDAHSDYIFAVVGEEFGALASVILLLLFAGFVIRGLGYLKQEQDPFTLLAVAGLLIQFGMQVLINIGVNIGMLPSKGMTLPFISYGGSSVLALGISVGAVLALTRCNRVMRDHQITAEWGLKRRGLG